MPSPEFEKRRLVQHQELPHARGPETTFDSIVARLHLQLQQENGYADLSSSQDNTHTSGEVLSREEPLAGTGELTQNLNPGFLRDDGSDVVATDAPEQMREKDLSTQRTVASGEDRENGLREAIRGIYRLWIAQSGPTDAATFLNIVKETLEI